MSEGTNPLDEAEAIIRAEAVSLEAGAAREDANLLLISTCLGHTAAEAGVLSRCAMRGADYLSAVVVATLVTARQWTRMFLGDPTAKIGVFAEEHDNEESPGYNYAHEYARRLIEAEGVEDAAPVATEVRLRLTQEPNEVVGPMVTHMVGIAAELLKRGLDVHNEAMIERLGGNGDSRS